MTAANHPFHAATRRINGRDVHTYHVTVDDRIDIVRRLDADGLRRVLALPPANVQATVRRAAEARLRKLEKTP